MKSFLVYKYCAVMLLTHAYKTFCLISVAYYLNISLMMVMIMMITVLVIIVLIIITIILVVVPG